MELLGNSEVLKGAFIALRTEVEWFCEPPPQKLESRVVGVRLQVADEFGRWAET
jgi:hypothetical protein